jgi:hypothetical protein
LNITKFNGDEIERKQIERTVAYAGIVTEAKEEAEAVFAEVKNRGNSLCLLLVLVLLDLGHMVDVLSRKQGWIHDSNEKRCLNM